MRYRELGKTGMKVSEIGLGGWGIGGAWWAGAVDEESLRSVKQALELGVNFSDSAPTAHAIEGTVYIGEVLGKETLVTAKCGGEQLNANGPASLRLEIGDAVGLRPAPEGLRLFDAATGRLIINASLPVLPAAGSVAAA